MKNLYIVIMLLTLIALSAKAQNKEVLNVWMTDGTKSSVLLDYHPTVIFNLSQLIIKSNNQTIEIPYDQISYFTYSENEESSISDVVIGGENKNELWLFSETLTTENFTVYTIDGQKIFMNLYQKDGMQILNLASLASGIYIIKVNNKSYKITKR